MSVQLYGQMAVQAAQAAGIDPGIFLRQINQESGFNPNAYNKSGATGIAQFMPETARQYGVDPTDPQSALFGAAKMMRDLLDRNGGDYATALAAYNAGQGNVDKYGGIPPFSETHQYVSTILGNAPMTGPTQTTSDPSAGMSDAEIAALIGGGGTPSVSGLPYGYFFDPDTKTIYRATSNGPVPVSMEEVQQAAKYQQQQGAKAAQAPNFQMTTDNRTGEGLVFDPRTGALTHSGQQVGYADVNPLEKAAADENQRGFTNGMTARNSAIDVLKMSQDRLLSLSRDAEKATMDRATLKSDQARTRATLTEQGREADLRAAVDQYQSALALIPALGQLSLDESKRVEDVLSNGSDYLARAFESQGGTSPLARVTQADQINALQGSIGTLRGMIQDAVAQSPVTKGTGFAGLADTTVPGYQAPNLPDESGVPKSPAYSPMQFSPAGAMPAAGTTAIPGQSTGPAADYSLPPLTQRAPAYTGPVVPGSGDSGVGGYAPAPVAQPPYLGTGFTGVPEGDYHDPVANLWAVPNAEGGTSQAGTPDNPNTYPGTQPGGASGGFLKSLWDGLSQVQGSVGPGYARGGFTRAAAGVVGDSKSGKPTGHEEMFVNPTNAPIGIISHDEMSQQMKGFSRYSAGTMKMPRFATGTDAVTDTIISDPGVSTSAGFGPADVSMGKLDGPDYDWYDPTSGQAGYGAFNPGYDDPSAGGVSTSAPPQAGFNKAVSVMARPTAPAVTQAQLADMAVANTPPNIQALFNNQRPAPPTALRSQGTDGGFLRPFTARQLMGLNKDDQGALNTRLLAQYNAPLSYAQDQTARMYGPSRERQRGFLGAGFH